MSRVPLVASVVTSAAFFAAAGGAASRSATAPMVYPVPQKLAVRSQRLAIPARVRLVTTASSDPSAVTVVKQALRAIHVSTTAAGPSTMTIYVGRNVAVERALATSTSAGLPAGGYVLVAGRAAGRSAVVLDGVDATGQFYAAQTLRQLVGTHRTLGAVAIRDWPSFPSRGLVEGFYGAPWTTAERLSMLDFMGRHKLNLYMFGPKDDAYLRADWATPFPASYVEMLRTLVARAGRDHVRFNLVVSPGMSICYTSPTDQAELMAKLQTAWDAGVRSFTIALDDIDLGRPLCPSDATFGSGEAAVGAAQAALLDAVDEQFVETHPGALPLIAVPSEYSGVVSSPYTDALADGLDPNVTVQWTGRYGVSVVIHDTDAAAAESVYRHPLMLWDNSFVTDYAPQYLALGPIDRHDPTLPEALGGIVADPMALPEASKLPLFTFADYGWNPAAYDPNASWQASLRELAGGNGPAKQALTTFADANWGSLLNPIQAPGLSAQIAMFWAAWDAGDESAAAVLDAHLKTLVTAPGVLQRNLGDPEFVTETAPWLSATSVWAQAARAALAALVAHAAGDDSVASTRTRAVQTLVGKGQSLTTGTDAVSVAGGDLQTFVTAALAAATP